MRTREEKNGVIKEARVLQWAGRIASCDFKPGKKKKKKKKKKEKHFGHLATFWFGTFVMLYSTTGCVVRHENTRNER